MSSQSSCEIFSKITSEKVSPRKLFFLIFKTLSFNKKNFDDKFVGSFFLRNKDFHFLSLLPISKISLQEKNFSKTSQKHFVSKQNWRRLEVFRSKFRHFDFLRKFQEENFFSNFW